MGVGSLSLDSIVDILLTQNAHDLYGVAVNSVTNTVHMDYLATIQVIYRSLTGVERRLAGYSRVWRWATENPNDDCRHFSLLIDAIWFHCMSRSILR